MLPVGTHALGTVHTSGGANMSVSVSRWLRCPCVGLAVWFATRCGIAVQPTALLQVVADCTATQAGLSAEAWSVEGPCAISDSQTLPGVLCANLVWFLCRQVATSSQYRLGMGWLVLLSQSPPPPPPGHLPSCCRLWACSGMVAMNTHAGACAGSCTASGATLPYPGLKGHWGWVELAAHFVFSGTLPGLQLRRQQ